MRIGQLDVLDVHLDDGGFETIYRLHGEDGETLRLIFASEPQLATGDHVEVRGQRAGGDRFLVTDHRVLHEDPTVAGRSVEALRSNRVRTQSRLAVLMVHWDPAPSIEPPDLEKVFFGDLDSSRAWFRENSYGQFALTGNVFGWFQVPPMVNCDYETLGTNAKNAARGAGVDVDAYSQIAYWFPYTEQCGWSGQAKIGRPDRPSRDVWYRATNDLAVSVHELLHNFGALHSRSYDCGSTPIGTPANCTQLDYGDVFDPMGHGAYHVNAFQKSAQGWFSGCNLVTATGDGTFDLAPLEVPSNEIQALRVPVDSSLCPGAIVPCDYFIEYRQPLGLFGRRPAAAEPNLGILIHVGARFDLSTGGGGSSPYLLDMTPNSQGGQADHDDASLKLGRTFTDPSGLRISLLALNPTAATVRVRFPNGGSGEPTCLDGSALPGF